MHHAKCIPPLAMDYVEIGTDPDPGLEYSVRPNFLSVNPGRISTKTQKRRPELTTGSQECLTG